MTPSGRRVLIVEDDHNILISLKFLLENAGYDVLTASDGVRGWAALEEHQPDLAVFDIDPTEARNKQLNRYNDLLRDRRRLLYRL